MGDFIFTPGTLKRIKELVDINVCEAAIAVDLGLGSDVNTLRTIARKHGIPLKKEVVSDRAGDFRERKFNRSPWMDFKRGGDE